MRIPATFVLATLSLLLPASLAQAEWHFVPPAGVGIANVKDYGAKGDGKTDDTQAILRAISENIDKSRYRSNPFIWFPNGTYLVSDSIEGRVLGEGNKRAEGKEWSAGWRSMLILIGETRDGVVIKLKDSAPGFTDPEKPKWILATGSEHDNPNNQSGGGNRAFRHNILNLTVDAGSGNPGAIGIDFIANNRGSIDGVTIRAGEDSGFTAIDMTRSWPGPAIVMDVEIQGFAHAMRLGHYQYGITFENMKIRGQRETAITNYANMLTMRNIDFEGDVPFYESNHNKSVLALLDSTLTNTGEVPAAIITPGLANLRRTTFTGYKTIIEDTSKDGQTLAAKDGEPSKVIAYDKGFTFDTAGKTPQPMNLPIEEIPTIRPPDGTKWTDGGLTGESLQAAIDSGAEYIFLRPVTTVEFKEPVILRNKVKLIMGMHGCIKGPGEKETPENDRPPAFIMGDTGSDTVCLEHMFIGGRVENPSSRTSRPPPCGYRAIRTARKRQRENPRHRCHRAELPHRPQAHLLGAPAQRGIRGGSSLH